MPESNTYSSPRSIQPADLPLAAGVVEDSASLRGKLDTWFRTLSSITADEEYLHDLDEAVAFVQAIQAGQPIALKRMYNAHGGYGRSALPARWFQLIVLGSVLVVFIGGTQVFRVTRRRRLAESDTPSAPS